MLNEPSRNSATETVGSLACRILSCQAHDKGPCCPALCGVTLTESVQYQVPVSTYHDCLVIGSQQTLKVRFPKLSLSDSAAYH